MLDQPTDVNQPAMAYQRDLAVGLLRYLGVTLALGAGGLFVMSVVLAFATRDWPRLTSSLALATALPAVNLWHADKYLPPVPPPRRAA